MNVVAAAAVIGPAVRVVVAAITMAIAPAEVNSTAAAVPILLCLLLLCLLVALAGLLFSALCLSLKECLAALCWLLLCIGLGQPAPVCVVFVASTYMRAMVVASTADAMGPMNVVAAAAVIGSAVRVVVAAITMAIAPTEVNSTAAAVPILLCLL